MTKTKPSKLDPHTEQLVAWFTPAPQGEGLTLDQARGRLLELHGLQVSTGRLSQWWESWQQARLQERVLARITAGAEQSRQIEKQFSKDAPPEVDTIIKLLRVLIMQLSVQATAQPDLLDVVNPIMRSVLNFEKVKQKDRELTLDREKFEVETAEKLLDAALRQKADELNASNLSQADKIAAMRREAFRSVDELQASGKVQIPRA